MTRSGSDDDEDVDQHRTPATITTESFDDHGRSTYNNNSRSNPCEQEKNGELEVIEDDDAIISPPVPILQIDAALDEEKVEMLDKVSTDQHLSNHLLPRRGDKLEVIGDGEANENMYAPIPMERLEATTIKEECDKLEVIGDGETGDDNSPPIPTEQLVAKKENKGGKLEVIGDGDGDDDVYNNFPPIPVQQLVASLEYAVANDSKGQKVNRTKKSRDRMSAAAHRFDGSSFSPPLTSRLSIVSDGTVERMTDNAVVSSASSLTMPVSSSSLIMGYDEIEQREQAVVAAPSIDSLLPTFNAILVDDVIYDAVVFNGITIHPTWWKKYLKFVVGGLLLVIAATVVTALVPFIVLSTRIKKQSIREQNAGNQKGEDTINNLPIKRGACFTNRTELVTAIDQYVDQNCSNNDGGCGVGQKYGWPMNSWCTSKINDMHDLFMDRTTFNEDISDWNVSSVTDMKSMFSGAYGFNGDLSSWDVRSVTDMKAMFYAASDFSGDLSRWDVSSVNVMSEMFYDLTFFNSNLSSWNVSSVTDMYAMFSSAYAFNGDLSSWDVGSVNDMSNMFSYTAAFNGDLSSWDVSSVTNVNAMFLSAIAFNGNLSSWDVSAVTSMSSMFQKATAFDSDLSSWNISLVTDMTGMFIGASSFNQDLCGWADNFPYNSASDIFADSGCLFRTQPVLDQQGPFCSSSCPILVKV